MRVPSNLIQLGKYTIGGELVDTKTNKPYQGYYYELSGKFFPGKEFNPTAPELKKVDSNTFFFNKI